LFDGGREVLEPFKRQIQLIQITLLTNISCFHRRQTIPTHADVLSVSLLRFPVRPVRRRRKSVRMIRKRSLVLSVNRKQVRLEHVVMRVVISESARLTD
jgi:hypothetical protein